MQQPPDTTTATGDRQPASASLPPHAVVVIVLAGLVGLATVLQALPLGMPGSEVLSYRRNFIGNLAPGLLLPGISAVAMLISLPAFTPRLGAIRSLLCLIALTAVVQICLYRPTYYTWLTRTAYTCFPSANPFYSEGTEIEDTGTYLQRHRERAQRGYSEAPTDRKRLTTYPPGLPLMYGALCRIAERSPGLESALSRLAARGEDDFLSLADLLNPQDRQHLAGAALASLLHLFCIALLPAIIALLARSLADESAAIWAGVLAALIPTFHLYGVVPNTVIAVIGATALVLAAQAGRGNVTSAVFSALFCVIGGFFSFASLPVVVLAGVLLAYPTKDIPWRARRKSLAVWAGVGAIGYLLLLGIGYEYLSSLAVGLRNNAAFYRESGRALLPSVPWNALEFCRFAGIPVSVGAAMGASCGLRGRARTDPSIVGLGSGQIFCISTIALALLLLLSGGTRGEVSRNWMALMGPFAAAGGIFLARQNRRVQYAYAITAGIYLVICCIYVETVFNFS